MTIDVSSFGAARAATSTSTGTSASTAANGELDKQAFLDLLVAQLRNQDPSSPMDSSQLMAQTTQLTTMEKLVQLSDTSRESFALQMRMAAASLVGQQVTWADADGGGHTGTVSGVSYAGSVPTVTVGDQTVALDAVSSVTKPTAVPTA
ncbi:flagellar hook capping protein [Cellulomonas humilata]|uniref:Flagellar hook capping protein n=1 Tax=Cellulomonas humilata TaxID=144055 RepID=A0A7Y6DW58_9CELL|nr:flagellar hook capping FlgD N-terminal domain-containing protein [Cellulomonas humilata]NUU15880.1 flagellar hook capping protein [Cellulomonas humilata]